MAGWMVHGADEALRGVFWDLSQIGDADGPKYPEPVLRRLGAKVLEGRAHEPLTFRLCHLVRCASFAAEGGDPDGWLEFFCAPGAGRPGWAAGWLRERLPSVTEEHDAVAAPPVSAGPDQVRVRYRGRPGPVELSYGAMPLLAAFMEFLLNTLRYDFLRDTLAPLGRQDLTWRGLQDTANDLSRAVYAWLRLHTRPVQESRDFEALAGFLAARGERGDFTAGDIDDDAVLEFWRAASTVPGSSFRTYRKTFRAFLRFAEVMDEDGLRQGPGSPLPLDGIRGEAGHEPADPSSPGLERMRTPPPASAWCGAGDDGEEPSPLEVLAGTGIRILLAGEVRRLALVEAHARLLPGLALSFLRDACFGKFQGRISQALRTDPARVRALARQAPEADYDGEAGTLAALLAHLERVTEAAAYALARAGNGNGALAGLDREVMERGWRALKGLRRRGFEEVRSGAPRALAALRRAAPAVIELRERLGPLCARLEAEGPWAARWEQDAGVFREQFTRIYAAAEAREGGTAQ